MKSNIAKGIIGNGLAQIVLKVIRILDQLLLVPFFLTAWGPEYYGEWITLSIIPTILGFTSFGFGTASSNSFVLAYTAGDKQKAANLNKSGILVIFCSIIAGGVLTLATLWSGKHFNLFEKSIIPATEAITAIALLMAGRLITFYHQHIEGFFRVKRKAAIGSFIYSGCSIVTLVTSFCVLYGGGKIVSYAISQFIISILFTIIFFIIGNKGIDLKGYKGVYTYSDIKQITSKGMGYMMEPVWQSIYFQGSTFVVRVVLGAESVAIFNTVRTACRSVSQIFNVINGSVFPELQYEYGKGNMQTVHRLFRLSILTSIIIGFAGTTLLMIFGLDIYNLWTKSILSVPHEVWYTFITSILFNAVWWTSMVAYPVTNKPYNFAIASTTTACVSVFASYFLAQHFGLWGAALGAALFEFIMMLYVLPDSCRLLGMKTRELFAHFKEDYTLLKKKFCKS